MTTINNDAAQDNARKYLEHCAKVAERFSQLGYRIIPLSGKLPADPGWQTARYPIDVLAPRVLAGCNIGMVFGQEVRPGYMLCALDVDIEDVAIADIAYRTIALNAPIRFGKYPKWLLPVLIPIAQAGSCDFSFWKDQTRIAIQVLGRGQRAPAGPKQAVVYGIHPGTGQPYKWNADGQGRNIFQMRPGDWPVIEDVKALMARVAEALAPYGWATRAKHARAMGDAEAAYAGPLTAAMIENAKRTLERELTELAGMPPESNRGTKAHQLGLKIGLVVRAGHIDLEATMERLRFAMPDNHNAPREFERGVMTSTGERQRAFYNSQNVDWGAKAKERGFKPEDFMGAPPKDEAAAEQAQAAAEDEQWREWCETYKLALANGALDLLADSLKKRTAEETRIQEGVAWGFMGSLLAAGMATLVQFTEGWKDHANRLSGQNLQRYGADCGRIAQAILGLQPTEPLWARYAAMLMGTKGKTPTEAIRAAQQAHKAQTRAGKAERGSIEAEILSSIGMQDWDRDPNNDAEAGSFSNLRFFMAAHLLVWPFYDEFIDKMVFRRLLPAGSAGADVVSEATLARWSNDPGAAAIEIYALARDRTRPWGGDNWSPKQSDILMWLQAMVGDDPRMRFNSVVDRLRSWEAWDSTPRLNDWLARYIECLPWEPAYEHVCAVGAHFMRNWIYRLENPGHKWDEVLVLVGLQGERKTTMFERLADCVAPGSYLEGQRFDYDGRTGINRLAEAMRGKTLGEMAELTSMGRLDMENFKAMVSTRVDSGRKSFGTATVDRKRQFGFVGTANCTVPHKTAKEVMQELAAASPAERVKLKREFMAQADVGFLSDPTGSRRFHPVAVNTPKIDLESLALEAPQIIAEARAQVAEDKSRLLMTFEQQAAAEGAAERFHTTDGLDDTIRVKILMALEGNDEHKIALVDVRRVLGLQERSASGQGAGKLNSALKRCGYKIDKHNNVRYAYKGNIAKAPRIGVLEGGNAPRLAVGVATGAFKAGE